MTGRHILLAIALLAISTAGPFIVLARVDAPAVVVLRLTLAGVLLMGWAGVRGELRGLHREDAGRLVAGAALLSAHFLLWVKAFDLTDYASNLFLLVSQPIAGALIGAALGERAGRRGWASVALAGLGLALIAGGDFRLGPLALLGDGFSVAASFAIALFYVVTRRPRERSPIAAFLAVIFLGAALFALPFVPLLGGRLAPYPAASLLWIAGLALVTTIAGHGLMNLSARRFSLFTINLVIVLEPFIALALGALIWGAALHPTAIAGGAILGAAVVLGVYRTRSSA